MAFSVQNLNVNADDLEQLGTKEKFWFRYEDRPEKYLFKYSRDKTGEHWSEKAAEQLCRALGIPHASYDIATMNGRYGVISKNIIPDNCRMVMGNEVLHKDSPSIYPEPELRDKQFVRVKEHTVSRVLACLDRSNTLPPPNWEAVSSLNAGDIFCGYLMLDALISNQDRHHENWAIVLNTETQEKYLCETYDHAASLGRELLDEERHERLTTKDQNRSLEFFVRKARSEIFKMKHDKKPLLTIDAFFTAIEEREAAKKHWIEKLRSLSSDEIYAIFENIPPEIITETSREFSAKMVFENQRRLLTDDRA
ncbi:hypothetical protein ACI2KX_09330 [Ectopseudomonas khazarica]|uniref:hypothetical protein n=1 Tax=Ectopseudomonas khazarica TaxID=2502979 RepID=UPI003850087D